MIDDLRKGQLGISVCTQKMIIWQMFWRKYYAQVKDLISHQFHVVDLYHINPVKPQRKLLSAYWVLSAQM